MELFKTDDSVYETQVWLSLTKFWDHILKI